MEPRCVHSMLVTALLGSPGRPAGSLCSLTDAESKSLAGCRAWAVMVSWIHIW